MVQSYIQMEMDCNSKTVMTEVFKYIFLSPVPLSFCLSVLFLSLSVRSEDGYLLGCKSSIQTCGIIRHSAN